MDAAHWHISPCPHCGGLIKLPKKGTAAKVACPRCAAVLDLAALAAPPPADPAPSAPLPAQQAMSPKPVNLRGTGRETWQPDRPLKEVDFKDRLQKTTAPELYKDPNEPKGRRVKKVRHFSQTPSVTGWDDDSAAGHPARTRRDFWRRIPWGLVGVFAVLLLVAGYLSLRSIFHRTSENVVSPPPAEAKRAAPANPEDRLELMATAEFLPAASKVLLEFLSAETPEELRPLIREPDRVFPLLQAYYREQKPYAPLRHRGLPKGMDGGITLHKRFVVITVETEKFEQIPVTLEKTPTGFKVDWESYVIYGDMPVETFLKERPRTPVLLRAVLSAGDYFNEDFPDKTTHACVGISLSREDTRDLFGYVVIGSVVQQKLLQSAVGQGTRLFCVLRLRYPENSTNARQVEITDCLQTGWVFRQEDVPMPQQANTPPAPATPGL